MTPRMRPTSAFSWAVRGAGGHALVEALGEVVIKLALGGEILLAQVVDAVIERLPLVLVIAGRARRDGRKAQRVSDELIHQLGE